MIKKRFIIAYAFCIILLLNILVYFFKPYIYLSYAKYLGQKTAVPPEIGMYDPLLGWKPKPLSQATSWRTGEPIDYIINEKGMRSFDNKGQLSGCHIFALGDSNTFGHAISMSNHWLTRMKESFPKFGIHNLGVEGYGVDQELIRLKQEILNYRPVLVLVFVKHFIGHRHLHSKMFGGKKPYFSIDAQNNLNLHNKHIQPGSLSKDKINMPYKNTSENSFHLGVRLIQEMHIVAKKQGARFLLMAGWKSLCEGISPTPCINVKPLLKNSSIIGADGSNFLHINAETSKKIGKFVGEQIKILKLMPSECF